MLKTVEEVQEKYPGIRLSLKWDPEKPVNEHGKGFIDMSGQKFNHLTVLEQFPFNTKDKKSIWIVQCDCEATTIFTTTGKNLRTGNTKSCGCAQVASVVKRNYKHGLSYRNNRSRLYTIYRDMIRRCSDESRPQYSRYGGSRIKVCDEWLGEHGFENFVKWSFDNGYVEQDRETTPYRMLLTIERHNVDKGYSPDNCGWIPLYKQSRNRHDRKRFIIAGISITAGDITEHYGLSRNYIDMKFQSNWTADEILRSILNNAEPLNRQVMAVRDSEKRYVLIPNYANLDPWSDDPYIRNFARAYLSDEDIEFILEIKKNTKQ